ncbi:MAG: hypothetical protein KHZ58_17660 [Hungatella hathewayi]|nr:hypothetical protein [Hungatella hathewayi]
MVDEKLLDMMLDERIDDILNHVKRHKNKKYHKKMIEAENVIDSLSKHDKDLVENYCNNMMDLFCAEQKELYKQGFIDGVRILKKLMEL